MKEKPPGIEGGGETSLVCEMTLRIEGDLAKYWNDNREVKS